MHVHVCVCMLQQEAMMAYKFNFLLQVNQFLLFMILLDRSMASILTDSNINTHINTHTLTHLVPNDGTSYFLLLFVFLLHQGPYNTMLIFFYVQMWLKHSKYEPIHGCFIYLATLTASTADKICKLRPFKCASCYSSSQNVLKCMIPARADALPVPEAFAMGTNLTNVKSSSFYTDH